MDKKIIKISQRKRQLRERKQKIYADVWALGEDELESGRAFSVAEKLASPNFAQKGMVKEIKGPELTVAYFQQFGFNIPLLVKQKDGLGIQVPSSNFSINDVRMCVGSNRILDVMDVNTQKNIEMSMKEWQRYYEDPNKKKLLNVISLEFSHTKLDNYVQCPTVVREIDWNDVVWPKSLKAAQIEETNSLDSMMYPKVQKYCLMSVKNCYTDFHIDFGGTSVWYHILKGSKVFWLIPPTEKNLALYEKWVLSGKQSSIFFGDAVEKCTRLYLTAGNTFFIPSGWIHAVYTPTDSLVFGGNFLHSYSITKQLKIAQVEDSTKVPIKFRYPFFTEMLWYVLSQYVAILLRRNHLDGENDIKQFDESEEHHVHLTNYELFGLKEIVLYLYDLPQHKKNVPELLKDPVELIKDVRLLVEKHCKDENHLAITGVPVLNLKYENNECNHMKTFCKTDEIIENDSGDGLICLVKNHQTEEKKVSIFPIVSHRHNNKGTFKKSYNETTKNNQGVPRRRRTRCKTCEACSRSDCGECTFCLDMVKFGGPGKAKQTCQLRACLQPMLPITCICAQCQLDGWNQLPKQHQHQQVSSTKSQSEGASSSLMECSVCYEISHPECIQKNIYESKGIVNEDLPNSWQCPLCCESGKNADYRPRHFRARPKCEGGKNTDSIEDNANAKEVKNHTKFANRIYDKFSDSEEEASQTTPSTSTIIKTEDKLKSLNIDESVDVIIKKRKSGEETNKEFHSHFNLENNITRKRNALRAQLAQQIISSSSKLLKKPVFPVRPSFHTSQSSSNSNLALDKNILFNVFKYLSQDTLVICSSVCKIWADIAVSPKLWLKMNCAEQKMSANLLMAIVRRQPENIILDWTQIAKQQLAWIISRITCLRALSLEGVPIQSIFALHTCLCPQLTSLNLSFVRGLSDHAIRELILSPPKDSARPGTDSKSRLRNLKTLKLSGTDISDIALRYITHSLPKLEELDLSSVRITDVGICQIGTSLNSIKTLHDLNLANCKLITEQSLEYLEKCEALTRLDLRFCPLISTQEVIKFAAKSKNDLHVKDVKLVDKRDSKLKYTK